MIHKYQKLLRRIEVSGLVFDHEILLKERLDLQDYYIFTVTQGNWESASEYKGDLLYFRHICSFIPQLFPANSNPVSY